MNGQSAVRFSDRARNGNCTPPSHGDPAKTEALEVV